MYEKGVWGEVESPVMRDGKAVSSIIGLAARPSCDRDLASLDRHSPFRRDYPRWSLRSV